MNILYPALLACGLAALFPAAPLAAQIPRELRDTLVIEEVLRQREVVDSAQRAAEEAFRRTALDIQNAFSGMAQAEEVHRSAMEAWLSHPTEETEAAYTEAAARSTNASVRHLDPIVTLNDNLRNRLAPVSTLLQGNIRSISERLVRASGFTSSIQAASAEHQAAYDQLAYKLVETGQIEKLDALLLREKADLLGMETTGRLLAFVDATMSRHEVQLRASRERLRRYVQSLENSVMLAGTVAEQAVALQGAFQTVAYTFGEQVHLQDVERAFEGVLDLEEGLQGAAVNLLEQGESIAQFTPPDPTSGPERQARPMNMAALRDRLWERYNAVTGNRNRE